MSKTSDKSSLNHSLNLKDNEQIVKKNEKIKANSGPFLFIFNTLEISKDILIRSQFLEFEVRRRGSNSWDFLKLKCFWIFLLNCLYFLIIPVSYPWDLKGPPLISINRFFFFLFYDWLKFFIELNNSFENEGTAERERDKKWIRTLSFVIQNENFS